MDFRSFRALEHWMIRHPPRQTLRWCYRRYFTTVGNENYIFQASYSDRRGQPQTIRLAEATDISITRHVKIKAAANPYDPFSFSPTSRSLQ